MCAHIGAMELVDNHNGQLVLDDATKQCDALVYVQQKVLWSANQLSKEEKYNSLVFFGTPLPHGLTMSPSPFADESQTILEFCAGNPTIMHTWWGGTWQFNYKASLPYSSVQAELLDELACAYVQKLQQHQIVLERIRDMDETEYGYFGPYYQITSIKGAVMSSVNRTHSTRRYYLNAWSLYAERLYKNCRHLHESRKISLHPQKIHD